MRYCPQCNSKLKKNTKFCPECGMSIILKERDIDNRKVKSTKNKMVFAVLLAVAVTFAVIAVIFLPKNTIPEQDELSAEEIFNLVAPSTVEIQALSVYGDITGTGFFIDDKGTTITNYHVIENCVDADILLPDGTKHSIISILGYDENLDIAILSTTCTQSVPVAYREEMVSTGEKVYTLGSSLGLSGTFAEGIVSSANRKINGQNFIQTTAPISSGNSGGPLIDKNGKVVGVTTASFDEGQNLNLAIPIVLAMNIEREPNFGIFLKKHFLDTNIDESDYFLRLAVEMAINSYIEKPNEKNRTDLMKLLEE